MGANIVWESRLRQIHRGLYDELTSGLLEGGEQIRQLASELAPEETGQLKGSGEVVQVSYKRVEVSFGNGLTDSRAIHVEYGTSDSAAQPYLLPAARAINLAEYVAKHMFRRTR